MIALRKLAKYQKRQIGAHLRFDKYSPLQKGAEIGVVKDVYYSEEQPRALPTGIVHCFWTLKTVRRLKADFMYTVMPDACIDFVFDTARMTAPIVMTPTVAIETLNLGTKFHYVGVRFNPGVFKNGVNLKNVIGNQKELDGPLLEGMGMTDTALLASQSEQDHYVQLEKAIGALIDSRLVERNNFIENVLRSMQHGLTINEVADKAGYSSRQLRRKVYSETGYSPLQLRRIVRFQSVLSSGEYELKFADQSHLIKEFKAVTGVSYASFARKFIDVRKVQS